MADMQTASTKKPKEKNDARYQRIVQDVQGLYEDSLSEPEANEAARNLIAFCRILLEHEG